MVTRQATPRHTWVLLLIVPFLLPLAGCEPTTPKTTPPKTTEPTSAGTTWTVASYGAGALDGGSGTGLILGGVAWGGGRFVAVGLKIGDSYIKELIVHSTDGTTWTAAPSVVGTHILRGVAWGSGRFVAVGSSLDGVLGGGLRSTGVGMHSTDGATWSAALGIGEAGDAVSTYLALAYGLTRVTWGGGRFVAVGNRRDGYRTVGESVHSTDGATWTAASPMNGAAWEAGNVNISGVTYDGTRFVAVGDSGGAGARDGLILTSP